jgi:hypothetical protein
LLIAAIEHKDCETFMDTFHNTWLCRYPQPIIVTSNNGGEFKSVFKEMCDNLGIKFRPTTSYNIQGNSIIEIICQVMGNMLRAFEFEERDLDPVNPGDEILQACAYAIRTTYHTILQASPGKLIFHRDMIDDVRFRANWDIITNNKRKFFKKSNKRENVNILKHKYKVGCCIILRKPGLRRKLSAPKEGPYTVLTICCDK